MKVHLHIALTVLLGFGTAAEPGADVYILRKTTSSSSSTQPLVPREMARHILLQRASPSSRASSLTDPETAVDYMTQFGRAPAALFGTGTTAKSPAQLVVFIEGVTDQNSGALRKALVDRPAFTVVDPPSAGATTRLLATLAGLGVETSPACSFDLAVNPFEGTCWTGSSLAAVLRLDVAKNPETISAILDNLSRLTGFVSSGDLEATLFLMPESSRRSPHALWSPADAAHAELKARDATEQSTAKELAARKVKSLPACFASQRACAAQTANCSGHGLCVAARGGDESCFQCRCSSTTVDGPAGRRATHWAGAACQKEDRSTSFWLLAGSTLAMAGAAAFAVGLLFSVGEEELPGVIAAGVSRSK